MYRHTDSRTNEPRSQPPTRWSQGRKRQSDGNFRRRNDEEETIFEEKPSLSSDRRPDRHPDLRNFSNPKAKEAHPLYLSSVAKKTKRVNAVKNAIAYQRYIKAVPKHTRQKRHPRTPDRFKKCTRKIWGQQIKSWCIALQAWDPPKEGNDDLQPFSGDKTASEGNPVHVRPNTWNKKAPGYTYWHQRRQSRFDQPPQDKDKPTNVGQLEDAADLERKWSSIRELIREHRQKQQSSGASPSRLPPVPHAEQLRTSGNNREGYARPQALLQDKRPTPGKSQVEQHLVGPSGLFTENKDYESRREGAAAVKLPSWAAALSTSWAAASPADSLSQRPTPPPRTASTHQPAQRIPQSAEHISAVPDTEVLRLIRSIDAHDDEFDQFGKRIASRCRLLPSKVRSQLQAVIEGAVAAYELANPAQLPTSAYVVDLIRKLCGVSLSLPTVSLAPQSQPASTITQTSSRSVFDPLPLSSLPSQPSAIRPSLQPVPPAPRNYSQPTPSAAQHYTQPTSSASHHYTQPTPRYYTPPAPPASAPPASAPLPIAAYFAAFYKQQFK